LVANQRNAQRVLGKGIWKSRVEASQDDVREIEPQAQKTLPKPLWEGFLRTGGETTGDMPTRPPPYNFSRKPKT
jgi:hypothetical protein